MTIYDAIVCGVGGVGSGALWQLARRDARVLGIDRFAPPHDRGSSHGETRVIRQAYFEHPDYVPLLLESYRWWHELETTTRRQLYHETGLIEIGPEDGIVVAGVVKAANEHRLAIEELSAPQIEARWPRLRVPPQLTGVFESRAGYLCVEDCVQAQLDAATALGAEVEIDTIIDNWSVDNGLVAVRTNRGEFAGRSLVVAAGAWAGELLGELKLPLQIRRKSLFWFATPPDMRDDFSRLPVFLYELANGIWYGFPQLDDRGIKVGEHSGGKPISDPLDVDRTEHADEREMLRSFLAAHVPEATPSVVDHAACMYTMTPDEHFIVDRHPDHPQIVFAAGLSGHGFKFTPVLGKVLADLVLDGGTDWPIDFWSLRRLMDG